MMNSDISSRDLRELRIYRLLGVYQFRKGILWLEKVRHCGSRRKNENYHPSGFDVFSLERYNGFFLYNACLHMISLLFTAVYALLSVVLACRIVVLDVGLALLTLLNIYCILLQRANSLRLKEHCHQYYRRIRKQTALCSEEALERVYAREPQKLRTDYAVLTRIRDALEGHADCVLTAADAESLRRIGSCLDFSSIPGTKPKRGAPLSMGLLERCSAVPGPYTPLQARADWLQRMLGVPGRKLLDCPAIITEDAACEQLYKRLFPEDSVYYFCLIRFPVYEAFTRRMEQVTANET